MPQRKETGVSTAFKQVADLMTLHGVDLPNDAMEEIHSTLAFLWSRTQRETREEIAARLEFLGDARMDYVGKEPKHAGEIQALPGMMMVVYGEATGARRLAKIISGDSDKGWLPSWRWGDSNDT